MTESTGDGVGLAPDNAVAQAAERLTLAARTGVPTAPVRDVRPRLQRQRRRLPGRPA
jgi:hypothetical protein